MKLNLLPFPVAALVTALSVTSGCRRPKPPPAPPPPVVTANQPATAEVMEWDEYPGRLEAVEMVELRARVSGYLQAVTFKEGAEVKKGDLLFVIDPRPYEAQLTRAQADLNQAQTRLELARNDLARADKLLKSKAVSEEEADSRSKAAREAEAGLEAARASVEAARLNVDYCRVTAPINGRIGQKLMTEGNLVNGNQGQSSLLTTIVSLDPVYCYFDADERSVLKYQELARQGKRAEVAGGKVPCELALADDTGFSHKGFLDFANNQIDPGTGTLRVRGVFENPAPDRVLQPGLFARVRVPGSGKYEALLIPPQAVGTDEGQ
jgi:RND family efflux transporter MFP subunit